MGEISELLVDSIIDYSLHLASQGLDPDADYNFDEHYEFACFGYEEDFDTLIEPDHQDLDAPSLKGWWVRITSDRIELRYIRRTKNRFVAQSLKKVLTPISELPGKWHGPFHRKVQANNWRNELRSKEQASC